jgi:hypothetical protein
VQRYGLQYDLDYFTYNLGDRFVADAGYIGLGNYVRADVIKKKPNGGQLSQDDQDQNNDYSSIRLRVFGKLVSKFKLLDQRGGFGERNSMIC